MGRFVYKSRFLYLEAPKAYDDLIQLRETTVAMVYPSSRKTGKVFTVVPYEKRYRLSGAQPYDAEPTAGFILRLALHQAFSDFLVEAGWGGRDWRLYVKGRHYGPVIPEECQFEMNPIPGAPNGFTQTLTMDENEIIDYFLYWIDMDQAFYGRFGE